MKRIIQSDYSLILEIQDQKAKIEAKKAELEQDRARLDVLAEEAKKVFGDVEIISLGQLPQECAFITDEMTQGAFEEKLAQIGDQVLAKIRVKD